MREARATNANATAVTPAARSASVASGPATWPA
jgi:hypothetical protein